MGGNEYFEIGRFVLMLITILSIIIFYAKILNKKS
jgi:hypothetical protein